MHPALRDCYNSFISEGSRISKIRVYGVSESGNKVMLDTEFIKQIEYIDTTINESTGTVSSFEMFNHLNRMITGLVQ